MKKFKWQFFKSTLVQVDLDRVRNFKWQFLKSILAFVFTEQRTRLLYIYIYMKIDIESYVHISVRERASE